MGKSIVVQKTTREPTIFYQKRTELGVGQRELSNTLGLSLSAYAVIEEGIYPICGFENNPKVQMVAKFFDIPFELADEEAHKNLESGWHPAKTSLGLRYTHSGSSKSRNRGKPHPPLRSIVAANKRGEPLSMKLKESSTVDSDIEIEDTFEDRLDSCQFIVTTPDGKTHLGVGDSSVDLSLGMESSENNKDIREDIIVGNNIDIETINDGINKIRSELYGAIDFEKYNTVSELLNAIMQEVKSYAKH